MKMLPILVVEDDHDLREAVCDTLGLSGYRAIPAADGLTALKILQDEQVGQRG